MTTTPTCWSRSRPSRSTRSTPTSGRAPPDAADPVEAVALFHPAATAELAAAAATINHCLAAGSLRARVDRVLPLERAAEAHRLVEEGLRRRVVVRVRGS